MNQGAITSDGALKKERHLEHRNFMTENVMAISMIKVEGQLLMRTQLKMLS